MRQTNQRLRSERHQRHLMSRPYKICEIFENMHPFEVKLCGKKMKNKWP
jgi:hypothetical protein